jgi:hypothetical protein
VADVNSDIARKPKKARDIARFLQGNTWKQGLQVNYRHLQPLVIESNRFETGNEHRSKTQCQQKDTMSTNDLGGLD